MFTTDALAAALAGRYAIDRLVGEGGMAKVYLARDLRHNRQVALKVLRPDLGAVVGVDRFQAEIQVTANLQHPNLLPLFDSGAAGDLLFYVMPFVEGESLRARLDREKQLPVDEAVRLATAIAGALDYAHRKGVVHRDLKPENILIHEGQPLVADFGIALAISNAGGSRITQTGLSLGTPQYMSPEQATGDRAIDARTDIYSLGALTYEMLAGEPPHTGSTAQAVIARVLTETPRSLRATRPSVPEHLEVAVVRALEKLPADRFESAKAFSDALRAPSSGTAAVPRTAALGGAIRPRWRDPALLTTGAIALAAGAIAIGLAVQTRRSSAADAHVAAKFALDLPDGRYIYRGNGRQIAISSDGAQIAYVSVSATGDRVVYVRRLDDPVSQPVRGSEGATAAAFSPDGRSIAFIRRTDTKDQGAFVVATAGGTPRQISSDSVTSVTWGDGDRIIASRGKALTELSNEGGAPRVFFRADSARGIVSIARPDVLPGGRWVVLTYWRTRSRTIDDARIAVVSIEDGSFQDLGITGGDARYAEPGYLLFGRNTDDLYAVPFSASRRKVTGPPVLLMHDVEVGALNAQAHYTVSRNGTMVYGTVDYARARFVNGRPLTMVVVDRKGAEKTLSRDTANYESPRVSPDGRRVAVTIGGAGADGVGSSGTWIVDLATGAKDRISIDSNSFRGEWSRDGSTVFYRQQLSTSAIIWARPRDASAPPRAVAHGPADAFYEFSFGPPHGLAVIRNKTAGFSATAPTDIVIAPVDSLDASHPLFSGRASIVNARVSPSGKLICYASNETGPMQVYVTPIPGPGPHVLVSVDGGEEPAWSWDGTTVFYRTPLPNGRMMAATITQRPELSVARLDTLFADPYARTVSHTAYDVFPDGRFLMTKDARQVTGGPQAYVVLHWQKLLDRAPSSNP